MNLLKKTTLTRNIILTFSNKLCKKPKILMLSFMAYNIKHPHNMQQNMCHQDLALEEAFSPFSIKRDLLDTFLLVK